VPMRANLIVQILRLKSRRRWRTAIAQESF
jgi:hypothetical protein